MADRITHGPKDAPAKPQRSPAGPDTIRGAAGRRVADRITSGSWKPTGAHKSASGSTPTTIRSALRARAADRILNGRKPKPGTTDNAADPKEQAAPTGQPGTDIAVPPDATTGPKPDGGRARGARVKPPKRPRRKRRLVTPGGATGARPWRSRPGQGRSSREHRSRRDDRWRQHAQRARWRFRRSRKPRAEEATPPAGHGASAGPDGGFAPPPGWAWTEGETITVERADGGPRKPRPPAALGRGQAALPRAPHRSSHTRPGTIKPPSPPPSKPVGGQPVTIPPPRTMHGTQYADAELTIYDVIEADADMGEEITQGAAEAKQAAADCEELAEQLETLHTKVLALKVPGILATAVAKLIEKTAQVKARAEAVAEKIPAAAEAITAAGDNAAARHKPLADAVRDAGHTAPAERDYHNE
ncbi:hypothetical protein ACFWIQ_10990 [Kitasatospora sp. NPDC127059]|uniref:hypothetical protein n=1 Tax=unclassified Kitasatospora TaxID=2633591 RepID=UPI00365C356D